MRTANLPMLPRVMDLLARVLLAASLIFPLRSLAAPVPKGLDPAALAEIQALLNEKASWTPTQCKMESQLIHAWKKHRGQAFAPGAPDVEVDVDVRPDGRVLVDMKAKVTPELLALIGNGGGQVISSFPRMNAIRALVALDQLDALAAVDDVASIRRADQAHTNTGSVDSEGDTTHRAVDARATFGVDGTGIKVGVLSDSVDYYTNAQASGDLGTLTILPGQSGLGAGNAGEGTAMLEIVHDLAPNAPLYFATAFNGEASFAQNILNLYSNGCRIIIDDVGYFDESPFQDGVIAQAVNTVTAAGALYFSAAGNSGRLDAGTSGTWEGDFVDGGAVGFPETGNIHNFGAATYNTVASGGSSRRVDLFWSDPLGASSNDYDLFILRANRNSVTRFSMNTQNGTQDPYESVGTLNVGERIVIVKRSGAARFIHLSTGRAVLTIPTSGATAGHQAASNAFDVAAVDIHTAYPNPFTGGSANPVETFSSDGPRQVFYNPDGTPITPGNLSSTGGFIRQKPDITAADGVSTTLPGGSGLNPFYGTSAAAPHAGAVAALVWSYNPALTPAQMRTILTSTALDIDPAGFDRDSGAGIVMAYQALQAVSATPPVIVAQPTNQTAIMGTTATFNVTATGSAPLIYQWRFGATNIGGATASSYSRSALQAANAGAYTVVVTNAAGTVTSSVAGLAVVGFAAGPTSGAAPFTVFFTNLSGGASNYSWTFGDGNTSTAANPANTYTNAGIYTVSLTATGGGLSNTQTRTNYVVVTNPPPAVANFIGSPTNGVAPLTVSFTNLSSGATNYSWNFGDGHTSTALNAANTYSNAGTYTVNLTAIGAGGTNTLSRANYIVVTNPPQPVANFTGAPTNGIVPLTVSFTNLSSGATNYAWNFGDGHSSTATNAANTYSNAGTYTVSLTAVGAGGTNTLSQANYIVVTNPPPPVADFIGSPTNGIAPLTVLFTNQSSGSTNYSWDFGDGNVSVSVNPTNTYTNAGSYTVTLTAVGAGGTNNLVQSNYVVVIQPAQLVVTPVSLDFGLITTGATVEASMVVSNSGAAMLNGSASVSSGNFSILSGTPFSVAASGWTNVMIGFTSETPGVFSNLVTFASNGGGSTNTLSGRAISRPALLAPSVSGTNFGFSFETLAGFTYVVKYKDSLTDAIWQTLQSVNGDGTTNTIAVPSSAAPQRFYQVVVQ